MAGFRIHAVNLQSTLGTVLDRRLIRHLPKHTGRLSGKVDPVMVQVTILLLPDFVKTYQTLIVGTLGFSGVMLTIWWNAEL